MPVSSHSLNLAAGQGHLKSKTKNKYRVHLIDTTTLHESSEFNHVIRDTESGDPARLPSQVVGRRGTNKVKK
jgi:hypothetical protein